jgi:hypothetical protein
MTRVRLGLIIGAVGVVALSFLLRPAAPRTLAAAPRQPVLWRGAYHVHSTLSDGSGTPESIAAAAAAAGLDFVILTDHGDATRPFAPPRVVDGVLMIDAVEISTDDGHYVALDLPQAPYPLAGEGRAVADDVRRLGGMGILAHPDSPRLALAWHDRSTDADGYEWINADTTWRGASTPQMLPRLFTYPFNAAGALAALGRYPTALFAERDVPTRRPQLALAAVDAHARIGWQREDDPQDGGRTLAAFPSYRATFGTFGLVVPWLDGAPSGEPARDARVVLHAIRDRLAYTAIFSMASPAWLALDLEGPAAGGTPGPDLTGAAALVVRSNAPDDATIRLLRNGRPLRSAPAPQATVPLEAGEPAAIYRAEMWLPARRGWPALPVAVSAARAHNLTPRDMAAGPGDSLPRARRTDRPGEDVDVRSWRTEHDAASAASIQAGATAALAMASLTLARGGRVSQFAALVADIAPPPAGTTSLEVELSASAPMRLSIQLREPRPGEGLRWRHSAYLDPTPRVVSLPIDQFRPIHPASGPVPLDRLHALLLVTDTVNGRPGDVRRVAVHRARWTRGR